MTEKADSARLIASLLGPVLLGVTGTELWQLDIWLGVDPSIVYLNGLIFLAAGVAVLRFHRYWRADWTALVTLSGWLLVAAGLFRMGWPSAPQAADGTLTYAGIGLLFLLGAVLTWKGYRGG
ncbi:hypothetical protein V8J82_17260 [Gymnodinialimonas sp. 2305UL16-5]|uniref:hypothetical protein n=1 Tax=Gymnodinialimonas mytili TaxID=3126503 RepID=UPI0030A8A7A6